MSKEKSPKYPWTEEYYLKDSQRRKCTIDYYFLASNPDKEIVDGELKELIKAYQRATYKLFRYAEKKGVEGMMDYFPVEDSPIYKEEV